MLFALPNQVLWLLLISLAVEVSSQPLTQYTCACPIYSSSTSTTSSTSSSSSSSSLKTSLSSTTTSTSKSLSSASSTSSISNSRNTSSTSSSTVSISKSSSIYSTSSKPTSTVSSSTSKSAFTSSTTSFSPSSSSKTTVMAISTSASKTSSSSSSSISTSKSSLSSSSVASKASTLFSTTSTASSSSSSSSSKAATSTTTSRSSSTSASVSTTSSKTATSTSTSLSASATPSIDSSGYHTLPSLSPNTGITASSYTRLSSLLPTALKNARSISTHSWELGTLANALTEVYYPSLSPFNYDSSSIPSSRKRAVPEGWGNETHRSIPIGNEKRATSSHPWAVLDIVTKSLSSHSWSGAPSTFSWNTDSKLSDYLSSSTSPVSIPSSALISGDGALGDPCSLGAGTWIAAEYFQQTAVQNAYANGRKGVDYAWAVGGQYAHLESGMRSSNGTLSQREDYFATWADMGYMIPPFLAYIGMATNSQTMLNDALSQWCLEASSMLNYNTMLFLHIPDWDQRPWATGNGWMLAGFTRVVASIYSAGQSGTFWSTIDPYESTVAGVFTSIFNQLNSQNLVPNYMLNTGDTTGDAAGTAIITAAYYRFRTLAPWRVNSWMDSKASAMFDAVVGKVGNDGWLTQVVNPEWDNGWNVFSGQSPEGQSFLGLMWAARTAAGV